MDCFHQLRYWQNSIAFKVLGIFGPVIGVVLWGLFFVSADQETGISGTFWAGGIELARSDVLDDGTGDGDGNEGHFSSGFLEEGLRPSNESDVYGVGEISSIAALRQLGGEGTECSWTGDIK